MLNVYFFFPHENRPYKIYENSCFLENHSIVLFDSNWSQSIFSIVKSYSTFAISVHRVLCHRFKENREKFIVSRICTTYKVYVIYIQV